MALIRLPYAQSTLSVTVRDEWLGEIVHPGAVRPVGNVQTAIAKVLDNPIGTPPLLQLAKPGQRVAVIIDDYTRKTPGHLFLPPLLDCLLAGGVAQKDIRIVVAGGSHRPMTEPELVTKVGAQVMAQYEIATISSTADQQMVYLGNASNNVPVWIDRTVAEADLRIGLGMITPHLDAGFSGGAKIILPGVCGRRTVDALHAIGALIPGNQLGRVSSPIRSELEAFVSEFVPLSFLLNTVLTAEGRVYQCVAGHAVQAHRAGVAHAQEMFGTLVKRRYPVVVANCHPYDIDLWQSCKGAHAGDLVTADDGTLILVTAAPEGNSTYPLLPHYIGREVAGLKYEIETGQAQDLNQATAGVQIGNLKRRIGLMLVSDGLRQADAEMMGIPYYECVEAAVFDAVARLPTSERKGSVSILPMAGVVLPIIAS
jgi:nickel-dependent lactate racemase